MTAIAQCGAAPVATSAAEDVAASADAKRISILGVTGSIGQSTLDLVRRNPRTFAVEAVSAHRNVEGLARAARETGARCAVIADPARYEDLQAALRGTGIEVAAGPDAVIEAAERPVDVLMAAIVGAAGLAPALAAVRCGTTVALANKETLVCAGTLFMREMARGGASVLPVDSEHSAIFQVIESERLEAVQQIVLTASGGPFRTFTPAQLAEVTPEQAVAHPNWSMGAKISVDSATMMNKGLELIEAFHLFGLPESQIDILVHPQSIVHSLVAYRDGSVLAQLGNPDMRTPIAYALAWPRRMAAPVAPLDLAGIGQLTFEAPDPDRFPALRLAREALQTGGCAPTVLNAANEIAVEGFLAGRLRFLDIAAVVERTLAAVEPVPVTTLADVMAVDAEARRLARRNIEIGASRG